MHKRFIAIIILALLLQACGKKNEKLKDNDIPQGLRTEMNEMNNKLVEYLSTNNLRELQPTMSADLIKKDGDRMGKLLQSAQKFFAGKDYSLLDEYYVKHPGIETIDTLHGGKDEQAYVFNYKAHTKESYVSLLITQKAKIKMLITVIYGKYHDGWKVDNLKIGEYALNNMGPNEFTRGSRLFFQRGDIIDASDWIFLAIRYSRPANQYLQYDSYKSIKAYADSVINLAKNKYPLPYTLTQIKSKPKVFYILPEVGENGFYPMLYYLTTTPISDTVALKKENDEIQHIAGQVFQGIDKNNPVILYRAFNEMPEGAKKNVPRFGFIQKTAH